MPRTYETTCHVNGWADLRQYGVNYLTGESCAFGMRLLCDLSQEGAQLVTEYLGLTGTESLATNWNSMVGDAPALYSVMLPREILIPLANFAMFRDGALAVIVGPGGVTGVFKEDMLQRYERLVAEDSRYNIRRNHRVGPGIGSRNTHAFSGRTA